MPIANFEVKVCTVCNEMYVKNLQEVDKYLKKKQPPWDYLNSDFRSNICYNFIVYVQF